MRVLAVVGSPRKGYTLEVAQALGRELAQLGVDDYECLELCQADLGLCRGCHVCLKTGEQHCPCRQDQRALIEQKLLVADGVILLSPVYAMNVPWIMKNFLDRFAFAMHRPRFFRQKTMLVCTTGIVGLRETLERLAAVRIMGFNIVHRSGIIRPQIPEAKAQAESEIRRAAAAFHAKLTSQAPLIPPLGMLMQYRLQQASFSVLKTECPADHEYFRQNGWLDTGRRYFVEARVGPLRNLLAKTLGAHLRRKLLRQLQSNESQMAPR